MTLTIFDIWITAAYLCGNVLVYQSCLAIDILWITFSGYLIILLWIFGCQQIQQNSKKKTNYYYKLAKFPVFGAASTLTHQLWYMHKFLCYILYSIHLFYSILYSPYFHRQLMQLLILVLAVKKESKNKYQTS